MNVLVTGGAGYIGSHTCQQLSLAGHMPFVLDSLENGYRENVQWGPLFEGDISNVSLVRQILRDEKIEAVIHFAGYINVGESVVNPLKYFWNNSAKSVSLLQAIEKSAVKRFVFSSTCATYGLPTQVPISEMEKQAPVNPYGESKLFTEKTLADFARVNECKVVALRYFNASGADFDSKIGENHQPETHLIPLAIEAVFNPQFTLKIFGKDYETPDGSCIRDYIHVNDLARAHVKAIEAPIEDNFSCFNVGTGKGYSVFEIVETIEKITGKKVKMEIHGRRPGDPPILIANSEKLKNSLQWRPIDSEIEKIVKTAVNWYKKLNKIL